MTVLYVALGGALGAALRYLISISVAFPFGTLIVNVLGCLILGFLTVFLADKGLDRLMVFALTGVLGGFTTFSTFSMDALRLFEQGQPGQAAAYVAASLVLSLAAVVAGVAIGRGLA